MTEGVHEAQHGGIHHANHVPQPSAGVLLRQLREGAGVHLVVAASTLKVAPEKLEALEHDRLDLLPDLTFARGLAAAICRNFGADPAPVLARMPALQGVGLVPEGQGVNQPLLSRAGPSSGTTLPRGLSGALLLLVGLLLLGALILWAWPTAPIDLAVEESEAIGPVAPTVTTQEAPAPALSIGTDGAAASPGDPAVSAAAAPAANDPTTAEATDGTPEEGTGAPIVLEPRSVAPTTAGGRALEQARQQARPEDEARQGAASAPAPGDSVPGAVADAPSAAQNTGARIDAGDVAFIANGDSWITVRDASGKALLYRTVRAGERVAVRGQAPYSVTVGRKDAVEVLVHGRPFDHLSLGDSTVARFQVQE